MQNYLIGVVIIFLGGLFSLLIKNQSNKLKFITVSTFIGSCFCAVDSIRMFFDQTTYSTFYFGSIFHNVRFEFDDLGALFGLIISVMCTLGVIYANGYLKPYIEKNKDLSAHCFFLPLLICSMLLVVSVQNALMFLVVWEIMSLSSFFLVIFEHQKPETLKAGIKYLVYMHISVIFIILTFALLTIHASSFDFGYYEDILKDNRALQNIVFILGFIGFGIKAGFVPFHNWLPDAHPAAPSHVSGIMSGVMIKTGIYGILRLISFIMVPGVQIGYFVLIVSVISALYGVLYAIGQHDLKRLLAYHSIENIGIIGIGIATGMLGLSYQNKVVAILGFSGCLLHILNHSIFKELLFLAAGAVYNKTHTRNIEALGGLIKSMPNTALLFLVGSIAICGLPPFNGFISEFLIYLGMLKGLMINSFTSLMGFILGLGGLALVGSMAILCFTKAFGIIFLGEKRSDEIEYPKEDVGISFIFPMTILGALCLYIGVLPQRVFEFISIPVITFIEVDTTIHVLGIMNTISLTALGLLLLIFIVYRLKKVYFPPASIHVTWGCGYNKPTARMQYSASSYASPFIKTLTPLFKRVINIKRPKALFVKEAHYSLHVEDVEEAYFLKPFIKSTERFFAKFEKMQNGNIQSYIMYGLIFLTLALIWVILFG